MGNTKYSREKKNKWSYFHLHMTNSD